MYQRDIIMYSLSQNHPVYAVLFHMVYTNTGDIYICPALEYITFASSLREN
jgi:hypothetical protein